MIRVAMLSFWHLHGADYAKMVAEHPATELVAIWDEDVERGTAEAEARGVEFVADLDALLAREDVEAVIVDCPTSMHRDVITAAARAGKHIFTEKVLAATLRDAQEIAATVADAGVVLTVSMWRSNSNSTAAVRAVIQEGSLGQLTQVRVRDGHHFALPTPDKPQGRIPAQFYNRGESQGGALIDLCHPIYLLCMFRGLPESVTASFGFVTRREVEDNAVVTFSYSDGALGVAETAYVTAVTPFLIEVHGTDGSALYSEMGIGEMVTRRVAGGPNNEYRPAWPEAQLKVLDNTVAGAGLGWAPQPLPDTPAVTAFEQWVAHVQSGQPHHENVALSLQLSAAIEAAYLSAYSGRAVRLQELDGFGSAVE
jgi:1,5-anhydro-D-fructose reductase (1,5-anhydro-D-mannitol-forming)